MCIRLVALHLFQAKKKHQTPHTAQDFSQVRPCLSTPKPPAPHPPTQTHTDEKCTHSLLSDVRSWQSSQTSVFLWSKCARQDQLSPAQGQQHTIHHKPLSISISLSLCAPSAFALPPSVFPISCLLLSVSPTTNAAQLRVSCMLYIASPPLRLCLSDSPLSTLPISAL